MGSPVDPGKIWELPEVPGFSAQEFRSVDFLDITIYKDELKEVKLSTSECHYS